MYPNPSAPAARSQEKARKDNLAELNQQEETHSKHQSDIRKLEQTLNELGFYHFDQIAAWTDAEVAWVDTRLKFKGRIQRDGWIDQAKILAGGGETEFSTRAQKGAKNKE